MVGAVAPRQRLVVVRDGLVVGPQRALHGATARQRRRVPRPQVAAHNGLRGPGCSLRTSLKSRRATWATPSGEPPPLVRTRPTACRHGRSASN